MRHPPSRHTPIIVSGKSAIPGKNNIRQPAAIRIDDANRQRAGTKLSEQIGWASRKQGASLENPFQERRGVGPRDSKKCNLASDGVNEAH